MSHWADNPEWFDEWFGNHARKGTFGATLQKLSLEGMVTDDEVLNLVQELNFNRFCNEAHQADIDWAERLVP